MKKFYFLFFILAIFGTSCTNRIVDFTIISTKNIDMSRSSDFQKGSNRIQGKDLVHIIIVVPTGQPNVKNAIDKAIESVPGCVALLDGVLYGQYWYIPYIYGQSYYVVEGTPLIDKSRVKNNMNKLTDYSIIKFDNSGSIVETSEINQTEYCSIKRQICK